MLPGRYGYHGDVPCPGHQHKDRLSVAEKRRHFIIEDRQGLSDSQSPSPGVCRLPAPDEVFECKVMHRQLYTALASLPDKQARRIYTHYVLGTSIKEIAMAERVSYSAVRSSILRGLNRIETCLCKENF